MGLDIDKKTRGQSLVQVSGNDHASAVSIVVTQFTATMSMKSGGCLVALAMVVALLDNVSFLRCSYATSQ